MASPRDKVLALLKGHRDEEILCFSGMGNVTVEGMRHTGIRFAEAHLDAHKMAVLAASTYRLFGFECAVVPFDVAVEAEALGCPINFYPDTDEEEILYPTVSSKVATTTSEIQLPTDIAGTGRIPVVAEAIKLLKQDVGSDVAVGTYVLGPFTMAGQIMELDQLLKVCIKDPEAVKRVLDVLTDFLLSIIQVYTDAGADYITVREMGAGSDVLRPALFKKIAQPHLIQLFDRIELPKVLHICGKTNAIIGFMNECGAHALSVEQKNDLIETRRSIGPEPILLGNYDAYNVLTLGTVEDVERAVRKSVEGGVDALWPGCDIWPTAPAENMKALMKAAKECRRAR